MLWEMKNQNFHSGLEAGQYYRFLIEFNLKEYEHIHYLRNHLRDSSSPGACLFQNS